MDSDVCCGSQFSKSGVGVPVLNHSKWTKAFLFYLFLLGYTAVHVSLYTKSFLLKCFFVSCLKPVFALCKTIMKYTVLGIKTAH